MALTLKNNPLVNNLIYKPAFYRGYKSFIKSGITPPFAYKSFRQLFCASKGALNKKISAQISKTHPAQPLQDYAGILGNLSTHQSAEIVQEVKENGFYVFDHVFPVDKVDQLVKFAEQVKTDLVDPVPGASSPSVYDRNAPKAARYMLDQQDIFKNPVVQEILSDLGFFQIAANYLECEPVNDLVNMWWSTPAHKKASDAAAQLYHFDLDRIRFVKLFIYLTDVGPENGPHMYIKGSHRTLPDDLWRDGRITDEEIKANYRPEDEIELVGKKGSIMIVDTQGLHKGKPLTKGERLIFQIEHSNSLFGQQYHRPALSSQDITPEFDQELKRHARTWQRLRLT